MINYRKLNEYPGNASRLFQRVPLYFFLSWRSIQKNEGSPFWIFFGTVLLFFRFFFVSKGSPFKLFDILQQTKVSESPKGLPFYVSRFYETVKNFSFLFFFENFLIYYRQLKFKKVQRVSPFKFFGTIRLAQNSYSSNFRFFPNFFNATYIFKNPKGPLF